MTLFVIIPALPEPYSALAGEYFLHPIGAGHFRSVLPPGAAAEWLDLLNVPSAAVLAFGSGFSWNCRIGRWGQQPGIAADCLVPGCVVHLPATEGGAEPATVEVYVRWLHELKRPACSTGYG